MDRRNRLSAVAIGVAALAILLVGMGEIASGQRSVQHDEPVDFIRYNDAVYLATTYLAENSPSFPYVPLGAEDLGPVVDQVATNQIDPGDEGAYPNEPCYWDSEDGTAPLLEPGDEIYAVRTFSTIFRIAAERDGVITAYQVWCSDDAEVGADLFDIFGRVEQISLTADLSESSGWATIDDPATIASMVEMLLSGPIVPEELMTTAPISYQTIVYLDDGTTFRASVAPGEFLWGLGAIEVPAAFDEALDAAWNASGIGAPAEDGG